VVGDRVLISTTTYPSGYAVQIPTPRESCTHTPVVGGRQTPTLFPFLFPFCSSPRARSRLSFHQRTITR